MRPTSIHQISIMLSEGLPMTGLIKEFIDEYNVNGSMGMIKEEPRYLDNPVYRVYLAGVAEMLARRALQPPPAWTDKGVYFLKKPVLSGGRHSRQQLMMETPSAFRRRLLFCGVTLTNVGRPRRRHSGV